jgi:hypothetical protein
MKNDTITKKAKKMDISIKYWDNIKNIFNYFKFWFIGIKIAIGTNGRINALNGTTADTKDP